MVNLKSNTFHVLFKIYENVHQYAGFNESYRPQYINFFLTSRIFTPSAAAATFLLQIWKLDFSPSICLGWNSLRFDVNPDRWLWTPSFGSQEIRLLVYGEP